MYSNTPTRGLGRLVLLLCAARGQGVLRREDATACTPPATDAALVDALLRSEVRQLGVSDAEMVMPLLVSAFRTYAPHHECVLIDAGANYGTNSEAMLALFSPVPLLTLSPRFAIEQHKRPPACRVLAFEPVTGTFGHLRTRAELQGWAAAGWRAFPVALSDKTGEATVYHVRGRQADVLASLSSDALLLGAGDGRGVQLTADALEAETVVVRSLDDVASPEFENVTSIFLLKVDVEGFDPHVLLGGAGLLGRRAVLWIVIEYSPKWFLVPSPAVDATDPSRPVTLNTLKAVNTWLQEKGYLCYLISPSHLVPLYGAYWREELEIAAWSNVLCGLAAEGEGEAEEEGRAERVAHQPRPTDELEALVRLYNAGPGKIRGLHLPPCA